MPVRRGVAEEAMRRFREGRGQRRRGGGTSFLPSFLLSFPPFPLLRVFLFSSTRADSPRSPFPLRYGSRQQPARPRSSRPTNGFFPRARKRRSFHHYRRRSWLAERTAHYGNGGECWWGGGGGDEVRGVEATSEEREEGEEEGDGEVDARRGRRHEIRWRGGSGAATRKGSV